jgi:hypothetical protein
MAKSSTTSQNVIRRTRGGKVLDGEVVHGEADRDPPLVARRLNNPNFVHWSA